MRLLPICLAAFFLFACTSKPAILSKQDFAKIYLDSLNKRFPGVHFELRPDLTISSSKGSLNYQIAIDNAYSEYKTAPADLPAVLGKYADVATELFAPGEATNPDRIVA